MTRRPDLPLEDAYRAVNLWIHARESRRANDVGPLNTALKGLDMSGRGSQSLFMVFLIADWFVATNLIPTDERLQELANILFEQGARARQFMDSLDDLTMQDERDGKRDNGKDGNASG